MMSLLIIAVLGLPLHIGHLIIDILWQIWIIHGECEKSDDSSNEILEGVLYGLINVLQIIELLVFISCVGYHWKTIYVEYIKWPKQSTVLHQRLGPDQSSTSSATDQLSGSSRLMDKQSAAGTIQHRQLGPDQPSMASATESSMASATESSRLMEEKSGETEQSKQIKIVTICDCMLLVVFVGLIIALGAVTSVFGYLRDRDLYDTTDSCKLPNDTSKYKGLARAHAFVTAFTIFVPGVVRIGVLVLLGYAKKCWSHSSSEISKIYNGNQQETSYEKLSYHYQCIGEQVRVIYNALEAWFLLQFILYSVLLTTDLIHVIGPSYTHKSNMNDIVHTALYISFDLLAFLVPYLMAASCNKAHDDYYKALFEFYQSGEWKYKEKSCYDKLRTCCDGLCSCRFKPKDCTETSLLKSHDRKYAAKCRAGSLWKKTKDFDFCPQIFGVSIPINSSIYTYSFILSLITVVFSFIQNKYTC